MFLLFFSGGPFTVNGEKKTHFRSYKLVLSPKKSECSFAGVEPTIPSDHLFGALRDSTLRSLVRSSKRLVRATLLNWLLSPAFEFI